MVTSGEHYGAVLNGKFDFRKYLDTLAADGLNHTRIFTGLYREVPGSFNIARNTLAPEATDFVSPFVRDASGIYDLTAWNAAYFSRPSTTSILRFVMSPISAGQHSSGNSTWRECSSRPMAAGT